MRSSHSGSARRSLRALLVEDNEDDAELVLRTLHRSGYDVTHRRVLTESDMRAALRDEPWEIVVSDYSLPSFDAPSALRVLTESGLDLPFIVVSGTIGEETAVAILKAGAHDFLLKDQLARFGPAVERELREAAGRRDRRQAVEALRQSESKFRRIVETAREGIWMLDEHGSTTYANARLAEMLVVAPSSLMGRSLFDFVPSDWVELATKSLAPDPMPAGGHQELVLSRSDGTEFWVSVATNIIADDAGRRVGTLAMVTDITEQRKLHEQLMVSDRMASIGTLAAGVAHEINNPLSAVLANLQLSILEIDGIRERVAASPILVEVHEGLRDAMEAAERVRNIVRELKLFSRSQDEERGPVELEAVVESSIRIAWTEIRHRANVVRDFHPLPPVLANESRLGQVFLNLLVNAAQAIEEGHASANEIRISTRLSDDGRVVVEIKDSGAGMSADVLRRLFTPFFTTKPIGVGTGLGLSICHRIISSFGGEMTVESAVGKGTAFRVYLLASRSTPPGSVRGFSDVERAPRRGRVLIVDDEAALLSTMRRTLAREHDVTTTVTAREAIALVESGERFDVVLCDLMMPHVTGMDLHAEFARLAPEQAGRMVFMTAGVFTQRARAFLDQVRNAKIEKPFDSTALLALVNRCLRDEDTTTGSGKEPWNQANWQ
ncbi:MAG TPA: response regulator [Polyangiaceae bacterium]|nr:response regulator [Polyangiaceae bacterium]